MRGNFKENKAWQRPAEICQACITVDHVDILHAGRNTLPRTSLVAHWLRLCAPHAAGLGSSPSQGTWSHGLQLRVRMLQQLLHAETKDATCRKEDPACCN